MIRDSPNDDKSVVSILKNGAREIVNKRVKEEPSPGSLEKELLKNISHNIEKEGGKGVPLSKPTPALNPTSRDTIEKNSGLSGEIQHLNPLPP
jgi:hypothetical protein